METHLKCVGVYQSILTVEAHSAAAFLGQIFITIFDRHVLTREVTVVVFEVHAVGTQYFGEELTFHLLYEFIESVAVEETTLLTPMSV